MRFKIDWACLIVGSKFTVLASFYFVFEGNFPSTSPPGGLYLEGDLTEGFLHYRLGRLIFGGAYTWRGLFSEFYGIYFRHSKRNHSYLRTAMQYPLSPFPSGEGIA